MTWIIAPNPSSRSETIQIECSSSVTKQPKYQWKIVTADNKKLRSNHIIDNVLWGCRSFYRSRLATTTKSTANYENLRAVIAIKSCMLVEIVGNVMASITVSCMLIINDVHFTCDQRCTKAVRKEHLMLYPSNLPTYHNSEPALLRKMPNSWSNNVIKRVEETGNSTEILSLKATTNELKVMNYCPTEVHTFILIIHKISTKQIIMCKDNMPFEAVTHCLYDLCKESDVSKIDAASPVLIKYSSQLDHPPGTNVFLHRWSIGIT